MEGVNFRTSSYFTLVYYLVGIQIFINFVYLGFFIVAKYPFYVLVEINKLENDNNQKAALGLVNWLNIHVFNSLLFNEEIYLMFLIKYVMNS